MSSQKESEFLRSERRMSFELHPNGLLGPPLGLSTPLWAKSAVTREEAWPAYRGCT